MKQFFIYFDGKLFYYLFFYFLINNDINEYIFHIRNIIRSRLDVNKNTQL